MLWCADYSYGQEDTYKSSAHKRAESQRIPSFFVNRQNCSDVVDALS